MSTTTLQPFDGRTYEHPRDGVRLNAQLQRVKDVMADCRWRNLTEIAELAEAPEASVSARLRDLRKPRFGSASVERRHMQGGLFEISRAAARGRRTVRDAVNSPPHEN